MVRIPLFFAAICALAGGCGFPEDMRCPDGFMYHEESATCLSEEELAQDTETETATDTETDHGQDLDGGADGTVEDTDTDTGDVFDGIGTPCADDAACASFNTDYCAVNPLTGEGYCSAMDCDSGGCPDGYKCCDCTNSQSPLPGVVVPQVVACLTDDDVTLVEMANCTCS